MLVDNTNAMNAALDPKPLSGCSGTPYFASWYPKGAVLAATPAGSVAVAHYTTMIRQCNAGSTLTTLPGYGRVAFLP